MKYIFAILLCALSTQLIAADAKPLRLGTEGAYPPFNQTGADGSLSGFDIDIGNAICAELEMTCEWVIQDWDGMIPALIAKKYDAVVASMSITAERKRKVDFTDKYYNTPLGLVVPKGSKLLPTVAMLAGKRVGVQRGTIADTFATDFWESKGIEIVRYAEQEQADADLASGRLDADLQDALVADGGFLQTDLGKKFTFGGELITGSTDAEKAVIGEGIGIALRKQDDDLRKKINKAIAAIREDGRYTKIREKYFAYDIY